MGSASATDFFSCILVFSIHGFGELCFDGTLMTRIAFVQSASCLIFIDVHMFSLISLGFEVTVVSGSRKLAGLRRAVALCGGDVLPL